MEITADLFRFPFRDERWLSKFLIGGLLGMAGIILFPLLWPVTGYGIRVMRSVMAGNDPSLPEWSDFGELFSDGVRAFVVGFVYGLPIMIVMCCAMAMLFVPIFGIAPAAALSGEGGEAVIGGLVALSVFAYILFFLAMGFVSLLGMVMAFVQQVAITRMVALDSLEAAFQFSEVWALLKRGFSHYLLGYAVWYGMLMAVSFASSLLIYTVILMCVYPLLLMALAVYSAVLNGAVMGKAYVLTMQEDDAPALVEGEAAA